MLLHQILEHAARRSPASPAVIDPDGTTVTFAELVARVEHLADDLAAATVTGDRVAVVADNCIPWVECYYAASRAGLVLVPLNQRLTAGEQADLLAVTRPTVLLGERARLDALAAHADRFPDVETVWAFDDGWEWRATPERSPGGQAVRRDGGRPEDVAWLLFTSGTTGRPKGAMLTHASLVAAVLGTAIARPVRENDVYLFPFPLCHVAGYNLLLFHLHDRPVVLLPRFRADEALAAIHQHRVTTCSMAPTMLLAFLDHLDAVGADVTTMRWVASGASGIPTALLRRALDRLGVDFYQGYGMTELSGNAVFLGPEDHRRGLADRPDLLRAAGRPSPVVSLRIVDDDERDVPPGAVGEIAVQGDQVTVGYWEDTDATERAFAGGWFHTGDLGRFDDDGNLVIVDRKKDIIVTGGENVSSREVEQVLDDHPGVSTAAVVGVPDDYWGETICAVIVRRAEADVTDQEIVAHTRRRLAGFKQPRHILFVDELPVNASGKVVKAELRRLAAERVGQT